MNWLQSGSVPGQPLAISGRLFIGKFAVTVKSKNCEYSADVRSQMLPVLGLAKVDRNESP